MGPFLFPLIVRNPWYLVLGSVEVLPNYGGIGWYKYLKIPGPETRGFERQVQKSALYVEKVHPV